MDTPNTPNTPTGSGANTHVVMAVLAYLGIFIVVSYLVAKDDPFVKFHIKQGLVLLVIEFGVGFLSAFFVSAFMPILWPLLQLINLGVLVLVVMGIVNVARGKEQELPVVGGFSRYFSF